MGNLTRADEEALMAEADFHEQRITDGELTSRVSAAPIAPVVDDDHETVNRAQLLITLRDSMNTCLKNAEDQTKPHDYQVMMWHFAEAGRQVIEMIEEGRHSGPISTHICEGCGSPTVVVQVTDDEVVLCPLCYAATPETDLDDRIQCPHCHWRPSASLRPLTGLYKCASCDFKWSVSVPDTPASTVAPQQSDRKRESLLSSEIAWKIARHIAGKNSDYFSMREGLAELESIINLHFVAVAASPAARQDKDLDQ